MNPLVSQRGERLECIGEMVGVEAGDPARGSNSQRTLFAINKAEFYPKGIESLWRISQTIEMWRVCLNDVRLKKPECYVRNKSRRIEDLN